MVAIGRTFLPSSLRRLPVFSSLSCLSVNGKGDRGETLVTDPSTLSLDWNEESLTILFSDLYSAHIGVLLKLSNEFLKDGEEKAKEGKDKSKQKPHVNHLDVGCLGHLKSDLRDSWIN